MHPKHTKQNMFFLGTKMLFLLCFVLNCPSFLCFFANHSLSLSNNTFVPIKRPRFIIIVYNLGKQKRFGQPDGPAGDEDCVTFIIIIIIVIIITSPYIACGQPVQKYIRGQ